MKRPRAAVHRTILVVDVEGFGDHRRTNADQIAVRAGLYRALQQAFREANISWTDCEREDRGDGALILAPAEMTKGPFIEDLPGALADALHVHNRSHRAEERVRLRMALHAGEINYDDHGVTATAINVAFRLLDATPLKAELAESSGVLTVIVSSWFFDEVVRHSRTCDPATYRPVSVAVKETTTTAWLHTPNHPIDRQQGAFGSGRNHGEPNPSVAADSPFSTIATPAARSWLLGRDQELARLQRAAKTAQTGRFTLALVTGEPGIGKSALTDAIGRQLADDGWTIAWGNCPEREGSPAGQPWTEILQGLADRFPPDQQAIELAPLLDDQVTLSAAGDVPAARFRLRTAISHYLGAVARSNSLLLVLDDLHQADGEVLALLAHLADDLVAEPVLVIAAYRPTEVNEQLADALATLARHEPEHVNLTGLDTEAVADLVRALCTRTLADHTVAAIARRTEGNPFFVREIARLLETDGEHAATGDVPPSVRHIVRRRVARLCVPTQTVLHHAAVIGREFTLDVLSAVTGMHDDALIECLDSALKAGLLVEPPHADTRSLRFAHALVSETLYHDISRLRRTGLHARVGAAMEHLRPHDAVALAHHFNAAQAPDAAAKAARYLRLAAEQAERRYAHREAAGLWQQAVLSYAHAPGGTVRDRLELVIGTIRTLSIAGEHGSARALRDDTLAEVIGLGEAELTARVIVAYDAHGLWPHHPYGETALQTVELIDRTLHELPSRHRQLRCRLLAGLAIELEQSDDPRGDPASTEAVTLARLLNDPALLATALNARFRRSYWTSTLVEREQIAAELLALGQDHGLIAVEAAGRQALIRCACGRGYFAMADEHAAECERLATTYDLPTAAALATWYHGLRHTVNGQFADAERAYQHAAELSSQAGVANVEHGVFLGSLSLGVWTGTLAELVDLCHIAYTRWPAWGTEAYALTLAAAGRLDEAHAVASRRPPIPRDIQFKIIMALRGLVGLALNDHDRITESYHALRPLDDEVAGGDTGGCAVLFPVAQLLGDLAVRLGEPRVANAHYLKAREIAERANVSQWMTAAREALSRTITQSKPYRAW